MNFVEHLRAMATPRTPGRILAIAFALACISLAVISKAQISISHLSTYATGSYNTAAAEVVAFDPVSDRIFFVNAQLNQVVALDASSPASLTLAFTIDMSSYGGVANSVCVVPGGIAVAAEASPKTDPGKVVFFDANGAFLSQVTVGAQPDNVSVTPNGQKVLSANEGEPNDTYSIDPEGSISIIDISGGLASLTNANVTTLGFGGYSPATLPGVRLFGPGASVAQDIEPEYITVSDDSQKAFVTCQENNAVVRIDLATNTIEQITGLGLKDHSLPGNGLDASDSPAGINIANWPVKGVYMPDAADAFTIGGQIYVAYANEGDAREWGSYVEPRRIGNAAYVLDPTVFPDAATLKQNANLGRLNATIASGDLDNDGDFDEIHVFGSRSFTIRDANGTIVWDSGDQLEQITAAAYPTNFNSTNSANNSFDNRSDDKGPEPEAITVAEVFGSTYAFIGLERIGGVVVYDVSVPSAPVFVQYLNNRDFSGDAAAGTALDLGPEDIKFVSASDSPDGQPFLIVGNEISGTVSLFRISPPPTPQSIAVWTYEPLQGVPATPTPNIGTGTSAVIGSMTGATTATGSATGCEQTTGTTAWSIGTANPGSTSESSGVEYRTSTVGYEDITLSYDHRLSNSATRTSRIQYTLDGTNWINLDLTAGNYDNSACTGRGALDNGRIDAGDPVGANVSDSWGRRNIDFSAIPDANNNANFGVRILAAHYSTTGEFRRASDVGTVATGGTWRFDNVTFQGVELPAVAVIGEPVPATLSGFCTTEGVPSTEQTFTVTATDISGPLVISAPTGFELREQGAGSYGASLNLAGPAVSATIEVRLTGTLAGVYSGNISISSTGAVSRTVGVSGETIAPPVPGLLAQWTYEPLQGTSTAPTPNVGSGTSGIVGSMSGAATGSGSTTGCLQVSGTTAWAIGTASPGSTNESSGVEFRTSTVGHEDIVFSYDHRHSNSSTRTARIQYTLDGANWINLTLDGTNYDNSACSNRGGLDGGRIDASDPVGTNVSDSWGRRTINFSAITGANNNPNFGVRILAAHYSTTGEFRQANNVGTVATGGTWRFDNVTFTGTVLPCNQDLVFEFDTDANPDQITWEIRQEGSNTLVASGGGGFPPNAGVTDVACLSEGCYTLRVLDAGGDGILGGGYVLRTSDARRIIDNRGNFSNGSVSAIAGGQGFCLPLGLDRLVTTSCDKVDWINGQYVVASPNAAVSAEWIPGGSNSVQDSNSGYEFWIFDPNGSYSFRRFRSHNVSDGYASVGATRACHMKINNWAAASQIPQNVLMNIRVRGRVNGVNGEFGPACRFKIDPVRAACPLTQLLNSPGNPYFSCGVTRTWGQSTSIVAAKPVSGANRYQFRFRLPAEGFEVVITRTNYLLSLNWSAATGLPLENGKTYDVEVRASKNGGSTWCTSDAVWGPVCQVTIGAPAPSAMALLEGMQQDEQHADPRLFPNPTRGDVLNFSMGAVEEGVERVSMDIFDLSGKRVSSRDLPVSAGAVNTVIDLKGELAAGMYLVTITAGDRLYSERLLVND